MIFNILKAGTIEMLNGCSMNGIDGIHILNGIKQSSTKWQKNERVLKDDERNVASV